MRSERAPPPRYPIFARGNRQRRRLIRSIGSRRPAESLKLVDQITVSHSCDIVADGSIQSLLLNSACGIIAEPCGIAQVGIKNLAQHLAGPAVHLRDPRVKIDILIQE